MGAEVIGLMSGEMIQTQEKGSGEEDIVKELLEWWQ